MQCEHISLLVNVNHYGDAGPKERAAVAGPRDNRGIATLGGAESRGGDLPGAAWGAAGACFYS